ncbi:MAG: sugar kinase [Candidatus Omnitrophica bacterium]|nr:sugar kinase [Candidatus Omnitrophota bacterium]
MSEIVVIGSVAIDSVESPYGKQEECFGGSASYFSYAARFFAPVKLIAVVGEDFPPHFREVLEEQKIDLSGLEVRKGKTFRWKGKYEGDMNVADTLDTQLNVFETFCPTITQNSCDYLFLANIDPRLQYDVLQKIKVKNLVASDTMNHWIANKHDELMQVLKHVDLLVINDMEARLLTGEQNLVKALKRINSFGPSQIVIKKGAHGAIAFYGGDIFTLPAYPVDDVYDPTGAGDSFAGGMIGYLAEKDAMNVTNFRTAIAYGTVVASFTVERFSLERLREIKRETIEERLNTFRKITQF